MSCKYKTYFDIIVSDSKLNEAEQYFKNFNIEILGIAPIDPYNMESDYIITFLNYVWLNNNINRIKKELKPKKIQHSIFENHLHGRLIEIRELWLLWLWYDIQK